jgi:dipeptidyl aminopeptidase/acylaminoacyl peptidase
MGKWHLGGAEERFPTDQGFDEWYGIPRSYDEDMWPSLNETNSMWPAVGSKEGWNPKIVQPEYIKEALRTTHVRPQSPPTILLQGTIDAVVPKSQSVKLAEKLEANNVPYIYVPFEAQFHAFDFFQDTTARAF